MNEKTFEFEKEEFIMTKSKIAVLWGLLIAMMIACAGPAYTPRSKPAK